jgi:predicted lipid-binding transport protein (Tim44 family)
MSSPMSDAPQFGTAEYKSTGQETCASCQKSLSGSYYRVNGSLACDWCAQQVKMRSSQDSHSAFVRALLFGTGGAIVGLILYSAFGIITGIEIGYVALAVGWLVGTATKKGSNGVGGRRYQIAAVALTYAAVSLSAIPIGISMYMKEAKPHAPRTTSAAPATPATDSAENPSNDSADVPDAPSNAPKPNFAALLGSLLFAGLASPFLELQGGVSGIIGLVILFVGVNIAWKITSAAPLEILGPFQAGAPAPPPSV